MTVCALPSSDLQTTAVRAPASCAAIAARSPAPPAPTTTTSYVCRSMPPSLLPDISLPVMGCRVVSIKKAQSSEEARVVEGAGREQVDVEVSQRDREEREPCPPGVLAVELGDPAPQPVAHRMLGEVPQPAAHDV